MISVEKKMYILIKNTLQFAVWQISVSVCCYMVTHHIEWLIEIEVYDICHEDMTGKRGGRMSQGEGNLIDLLRISSLVMFSGKTLHYSILMMSLVMLSILSKANNSRSTEFYDTQHS